jgi:hypothetical protein
MAIELTTGQARLLAEIGFLGLGRGLPEPAEVVFAALRRLRPAEEVSSVGLAVVALAQGASARAVAALKAGPQTEAVLAFRAVAHSRLGERALAEELVADLEAGGAAPELIEIARGALASARGVAGFPA